MMGLVVNGIFAFLTLELSSHHLDGCCILAYWITDVILVLIQGLFYHFMRSSTCIFLRVLSEDDWFCELNAV